jgi:hypothetical protein
MNLSKQDRSNKRLSIAGIRNDARLRETCVNCGSTEVHRLHVAFGSNHRCARCGAEWYANHCWNCKHEYVDSRDPATPKCSACGWHKCARCGACKQSGCSTNPYSRTHRLCGEEEQEEPDFDVDFDDFGIPRRCDWCGRWEKELSSFPFGDICESCEDSIGD